MSDSVEYMKKQASIALEKGDEQSSSVLTLCAGFLENVEEVAALRTQLAEARKDAERYRWLREGCNEKGGPATFLVENFYGMEWDEKIDCALIDKEQEGGKD